MTNLSTPDIAKRQILVNLGNRYVLFAPEATLPGQQQFRHEGTEILPRVTDESEGAERRIVETLQASEFIWRRGPQPPAERGA